MKNNVEEIITGLQKMYDDNYTVNIIGLGDKEVNLGKFEMVKIFKGSLYQLEKDIDYIFYKDLEVLFSDHDYEVGIITLYVDLEEAIKAEDRCMDFILKIMGYDSNNLDFIDDPDEDEMLAYTE